MSPLPGRPKGESSRLAGAARTGTVPADRLCLGHSPDLPQDSSQGAPVTPQLEEARRLLRLAQRDRTAFSALAAMSSVALAVACFHAQQAAEKALKAVLCLRGVGFRRTHDLEELAGALADIGLPVPATADDLHTDEYDA